MRMWNVDPRGMCRKHLLGEHVEMHMFAGTIRTGKSLDGFLTGGLVEPRKIRRRHSELAKEMQRRGYNHKSPLASYGISKFPRGYVDIKKNVLELQRRCNECFK